jgi:hypothetical protein
METKINHNKGANMTREECAAWIKETNRSTYAWRSDEILYRNHGIHLFYKGGKNGSYIQILPDGSTSCGTYEDAFPCITDAIFTESYSKKFANAEDALTVVIERYGVGFLMTAVLDLDREPVWN